MTANEKKIHNGSDEFYFIKYILYNFFSHWVIIIICLISFIFLGFVFLNYTKNTYQSKMIIFSKNSISRSAGTASILLQEVASPTGGRQQNIYMLIEIIGSERLAEALIQSTDYLPKVFPDQWDLKTQSWHPSHSIASKIYGFLSSAAGMGYWYKPDAESLAKYLNKNIKNEIDSNSGALVLSYSNADPAFSQKFLNEVYKKSEEILIFDELKRTQARQKYLKTQLEETKEEIIRKSIYSLIEDADKKAITLNSGENFFTYPIQDATLPTKPERTKLFVTIFASIFLGLLTAFVASIFITARKKRSHIADI